MNGHSPSTPLKKGRLLLLSAFSLRVPTHGTDCRRSGHSPESMGFPDPAFPQDLSVADNTTLARALIERHPRAPSAVFERFAPLVRGIVRRSSKPGDLEDAVQDVFASLFENAHQLRKP